MKVKIEESSWLNTGSHLSSFLGEEKCKELDEKEFAIRESFAGMPVLDVIYILQGLSLDDILIRATVDPLD